MSSDDFIQTPKLSKDSFMIRGEISQKYVPEFSLEPLQLEDADED
jgi:hypothetical protein